ncbi:extracellular tyrosine-protein kinase PKDCC-like [Liolophura sinensis]|uniref:extracellular tyrosine-protein kinase PKDCC-like n=1 Tax=Liolophura sinensis TaxID=3198878 RepID=UPI003158890E
MVTRSSRFSTYLWYICASSILICLLGNLAILRSSFEPLSESKDEDDLHQLKPDRVDVLKHGGRSSQGQFAESMAFRGELVLEHSLRKLMEDTDNNEGSKYAPTGNKKRAPFEESLQYNHNPPKVSKEIVETDSPTSLIGCDDLHKITDVTYIDSGWTKAVYKGRYDGRPVAIKTVDISGQEVTTCTEKGYALTECYHRATQKILKEIVLLQGIEHSNVIEVLGYCIPDRPYTGEPHTVVTMVTELGEPIDIIRLLQMWWEDRLRVAYDMTKIVHFLARTPYGSLSMNDFRRQQFVLVDGELKLSDVDDMGMEEPSCQIDKDCELFFFNDNLTLRTPCASGRCIGYNEKKNVFNAGRHFTTFLLPHGAPKRLRPVIDKSVDGFGNVTMTTDQLLQQMDKIVNMYRSGVYLNRTKPEDYKTFYREYKNSDTPGHFDYRCKLSLSGSGCTISVFDQREAEDMCNTDPECRSFVMTSQMTWTGRKITHLKNGFRKPTRSKGMRLFVSEE